MPTAVLHISDCHLVMSPDGLIGVDTQAALEAVLSQALAEHDPAAIIASGDLAHDPTRDVYQRFLTTVRRFSAAPLLCLPGNHDVLGFMQAAGLPMDPIELTHWTLLALDSHEDNAPRAHITAGDRATVARSLSMAAGAHALCATHHPLVKINSPWLDKDRIQNAPELVEWLSERSAQNAVGHTLRSRLRGVVFGHAHQEIADQVGTVPVFGTPSTCFQFKPRTETFTVDTLSPGYRWLWLGEEGDIQTQVRRVSDFPINIQLDQ